MKEYTRKEPSFSLCGLNCALCPRFHTEGSSRCPGCGGPDFALKHPTCAVVTCSAKHGSVAFCYECSAYPCKRYAEPSTADSFITYRNVRQNMADASRDLPGYLKTLKMKQALLEDLIANHNDGKSKGFYCLAVNLLPLSALQEIMDTLRIMAGSETMSAKDKARRVTEMMNTRAAEMKLELTLRK